MIFTVIGIAWYTIAPLTVAILFFVTPLTFYIYFKHQVLVEHVIPRDIPDWLLKRFLDSEAHYQLADVKSDVAEKIYELNFGNMASSEESWLLNRVKDTGMISETEINILIQRHGQDHTNRGVSRHRRTRPQPVNTDNILKE